MQTFLPYPSFVRSAKCLDTQRLKNQCNEAFIILRVLIDPLKPDGRPRGWSNHSATRMWRGSERALASYIEACCDECLRRGVNYEGTRQKALRLVQRRRLKPPVWLGMRRFHAAHRSNLLRKRPEHYTRFRWREPSTLPYVWPV